MDAANGDGMPRWSWPTNFPGGEEATAATDGQPDGGSGTTPDSQRAGTDDQQKQQSHQRRRRYGPRTCRICLEVCQPSFEIDPSMSIPGLYTAKSKVKYVSEDPELGRLITPCKCKGSQRYVHEGCLRAWRASAPLSDRNYWMCPTCHFKYRIERLRWGQWLSSAVTRSLLTVMILVVTIFVLGFIADPIINLWLDPLGSITEAISDVVNDIEGLKDFDSDEPATWSYHFLKGFLSLGLLGFLKTFFAASPLQWINVRWYGGGRRAGTGRQRLENISWFYVMLGVLTFLGVSIVTMLSTLIHEN
jgi:hypothetical protein